MHYTRLTHLDIYTQSTVRVFMCKHCTHSQWYESTFIERQLDIEIQYNRQSNSVTYAHKKLERRNKKKKKKQKTKLCSWFYISTMCFVGFMAIDSYLCTCIWIYPSVCLWVGYFTSAMAISVEKIITMFLFSFFFFLLACYTFDGREGTRETCNDP